MKSERYQILENGYDYDLLAEFTHYCDKKTGLEYILIDKPNEINYSFDIIIRTPAFDDSGVKHIIEHSVLCGSEKFRNTDVFKELRSKTANTFLNAFTAPDYTDYCGASIIEKDFYNILEVYVDAVFNPLLTKETFEKEGWRLDYDKKENKVKINGIVYNEMKAAYENKKYREYFAANQCLSNKNSGKFNSGGKPEEILNLTYEEFKAYYEKWYRPENAVIIVCGDINENEVLDKCEKTFANKLAKRTGYSKPEYSQKRKEKLFNEYKEVNLGESIIKSEEKVELIPCVGEDYSKLEQEDICVIQHLKKAATFEERYVNDLAFSYLAKYNSRLIPKVLIDKFGAHTVNSTPVDEYTTFGCIHRIVRDKTKSNYKTDLDIKTEAIKLSSEIKKAFAKELENGIEDKIIVNDIEASRFNAMNPTFSGYPSIYGKYSSNYIDSWICREDIANATSTISKIEKFNRKDLIDKVKEAIVKIVSSSLSVIIFKPELTYQHVKESAYIETKMFNEKLTLEDIKKYSEERKEREDEEIKKNTELKLEVINPREDFYKVKNGNKVLIYEGEDSLFDATKHLTSFKTGWFKKLDMYNSNFEDMNGIDHFILGFDISYNPGIYGDDYFWLSLISSIFFNIGDKKHKKFNSFVEHFVKYVPDYKTLIRNLYNYSSFDIKIGYLKDKTKDAINELFYHIKNLSFDESDQIRRLIKEEIDYIGNMINSGVYNIIGDFVGSKYSETYRRDEATTGLSYYNFLNKILEMKDCDIKKNLKENYYRLIHSPSRVHFISCTNRNIEYREIITESLIKNKLKLFSKFDVYPEQVSLQDIHSKFGNQKIDIYISEKNTIYYFPLSVKAASLVSKELRDKIEPEYLLISTIVNDRIFESIRNKGGAYTARFEFDRCSKTFDFYTARDTDPIKSRDILVEELKSLKEEKFTQEELDKYIVKTYTKNFGIPISSILKGYSEFNVARSNICSYNRFFANVLANTEAKTFNERKQSVLDFLISNFENNTLFVTGDQEYLKEQGLTL